MSDPPGSAHTRSGAKPLTELLLDSEATLRQVENLLRDFGVARAAPAVSLALPASVSASAQAPGGA
jgi:hypothetical protein